MRRSILTRQISSSYRRLSTQKDNKPKSEEIQDNKKETEDPKRNKEKE